MRGTIGFVLAIVGVALMWLILSGQHLPFEK